MHSDRRPIWRCRALVFFGVLLAATPRARAQDSAGAARVDALLRLVPADAAAVLTVEDLREQRRAFMSSRLWPALKRLPAVKDWIESDKGRKFSQSRDQIEAVLGIKLDEICDDLLGDAAVLALRIPPDAPADAGQARGLLLFQAKNRALLERLIQVVNEKQKAGGELARVIERQHRGTAYRMREFPPDAARPPEWYLAYPDGTFAFSNSESLIQSVIDRKGEHENGLTDLARFQAVKRRQNPKVLARLFIEPRQIERLIAASPQPAKPSEARVTQVLERYLKAVEYAGATLEWNDAGIVLNTVETLNPSKLEPWLLRWAGDQATVDQTLARVPATAVALVSGHLDGPALYEAICQLVPDEDRAKLTNLETLFGGLLLGQELRTRILPQLGPGVIAYWESAPDESSKPSANTPPASEVPSSSSVFAGVLVTSLRKSTGPLPEAAPASGGITSAAAIENALRTVLALAALDEKRNNARSRIITRSVADTTVTALSISSPFAYAVDDARVVAGTLRVPTAPDSRVILGTSPESVARYLEASRKPESGDRFRQFRSRAFPNTHTFFCVDLNALAILEGRRHSQLVELLAGRKNRPIAAVERDLAQVVALAKLFEAAFLSSRFEPESSAVHRQAGLLMHEAHGN